MTYRTLRAAVLATAMSVAAIPAFAADADPVAAIVNGQEIHRSAVVQAQQYNMQYRQAPLELVYDQLLDDLIVGQLLQEQALKAKYDEDPAVKAAIKDAQAHILAQFYLQKKTESDITDDAVKARYDEYVAKAKAQPQEATQLRHILLKSEAEANAVLADLKKGVKFEDEAKAKSVDENSAPGGGELGYFTKDSKAPPEFLAAIQKLKVGETTPKPVKTKLGYHVINVEARGPAPIPAFEEIKQPIRQRLMQEDLPKVVAKLQKDGQIKKFKLDGSPADAPAAAPAAPAKN